MQQIAIRIWLISLVWMGLPGPLFAHHSRAAYSGDVTEMAGELVEVGWRNPHPWFILNVSDGDGASALWRVEAWGNVMQMERGGVSEELFKLGDEVLVAGSSSRLKPNDFLASNLRLSNGTEVLLNAAAEPHWETNGLGSNRQWNTGEENLERAARENRGIFRVWSAPYWQEDRGVIQQHASFKPEAVGARAEWNELDNYISRCESPGMPRIMDVGNPHPFEFVDHGSTITLHGEEFDIVRTIHMGDDLEPGDQSPSRQGFSVGRWDGENTLVIDTTRIDFPYFDGIGTPQSDAIGIVERFTLSEDQSRLDFWMKVTDPAVLAEPAIFERYWLALGEEVLRYDCQPETATGSATSRAGWYFPVGAGILGLSFLSFVFFRRRRNMDA